jgi:hypothetical protein
MVCTVALLIVAPSPGGEGPWILARTAILCGLGSAGAALFLVVVLGALAYVPDSRAHSMLRAHGFLGFWSVDPERPPRPLVDSLIARARTSKKIRVLDVTGYELIGKGPGASGGLLHDMLASVPGVPVELLLLQPENRVVDPDHKHATVYQMVLHDMDVTPAGYRRKLRATLDAVEALNEKRDPESKIALRFYAQKPSFRAVVFDDSALVSPWAPREKDPSFPFLELACAAPKPSLYEGFRRELVRLWRGAATARGQEAPKPPSTVVRKRPLPEAVA